MPRKEQPRKQAEASLRQLIPGFKGSRLIVDIDGVYQSAFAVARVTDQFQRELRGSHLSLLRVMKSVAQAKFEASIKRPAQRGFRPGPPFDKKRVTGRFTFGSRGGGAFVGVLINDEANDMSGFGYPRISVADEKTRFVWRSLEYGLSGTKRQADSDDLAPKGRHLLPAKIFWTAAEPEGLLIPRKPATREGGGIEPKRFIRDSIEEVANAQEREYRTLIRRTYGQL